MKITPSFEFTPEYFRAFKSVRTGIRLAVLSIICFVLNAGLFVFESNNISNTYGNFATGGIILSAVFIYFGRSYETRLPLGALDADSLSKRLADIPLVSFLGCVFYTFLAFLFVGFGVLQLHPEGRGYAVPILVISYGCYLFVVFMTSPLRRSSKKNNKS